MKERTFRGANRNDREGKGDGMNRSPYIGVIGETDPAGDLFRLAEEVGGHLADAGAILVCGGMGGIMEAACRGAQSRGGVTIGILPGPHRGDGNRYLTYVLPTGLGYARNLLVVRASQALIAIGGRFGTLSEIAYAKIEGIPVVGLATWQLSRSGEPEDPILRAKTPREAAELALAAVGPGRG